jgi:hypothetical protein
MTEETRREYLAGFSCVVSILILGIVLELTTGGIRFRLLAFPVNALLGAILVVGIAAFSIFASKQAICRFTSAPFSVAVLTGFATCCLVMGIIPQTGDPEAVSEFVRLTGLTRVNSSWPFALVYLLLLFNLGCVVVRRAGAFRWQDWGFYLNHLGIWLFLFAGGLGTSDMQRFRMRIDEGETSSLGINAENHPVGLPMTVRLVDFSMEEYPPKLMILDKQTDRLISGEKHSSFQIDPLNTNGRLLEWNIEVEEYLPQAILNENGEIRPSEMPGATEAALLVATHYQDKDKIFEGWIWRGNAAQPPIGLNINEDWQIVMLDPEAKRYLSQVEVYTGNGERIRADIEVNKPLRMGSWTIYQTGYDTRAGRLSGYSVFEVVYDPWIWPVYIGIMLIMAGSVCMFWMGNRKNKKEYA